MNAEQETMTEYVDGRLSPGEAAAFEALLAERPDLARRTRLARAMRASLRAGAPAMPADLKAALKAEARRREARAAEGPRWVDLLREAWTVSPWAWSAGAAFAAAALSLLLRAPAPPAPAVARRAAAVPARTAPPADLWSDDDGSDRDD